jgi:hypothetical protein
LQQESIYDVVASNAYDVVPSDGIYSDAADLHTPQRMFAQPFSPLGSVSSSNVIFYSILTTLASAVKYEILKADTDVINN